MGKNLGPGHDVILPRCNPLALSPISRRVASGWDGQRGVLIRETGIREAENTSRAVPKNTAEDDRHTKGGRIEKDASY